METGKKFYVYALIDPRDQKIKYVGKGSGNRCFKHIKEVKNGKNPGNNYTKYAGLIEILNEGYEDIAYRILFRTDNEPQAYAVETEYIKKYNTLIPNGWNMSIGGEGVMSGRKFTAEARKRVSEGNKDRTFPNAKHIYKKVCRKKNKTYYYFAVIYKIGDKIKHIGQSKSYTEAIEIRDKYLQRLENGRN